MLTATWILSLAAVASPPQALADANGAFGYFGPADSVEADGADGELDDLLSLPRNPFSYDFPGPDNVVGGQPVPFEDTRWDGTVLVFASGYLCTGTLVAPQVVLTAAHCIGSIQSVLIGASDYTRDYNKPGVEQIGVTSQKAHPQYNGGYGPDIAVLTLRNPSTHAPRIIASDCIQDKYLTDNAEVAIVGWGNTQANGNGSTTKMHEGFSLIEDADCSQDRIDGIYTGCIPSMRPDGEIGAGGNDVDACFGDSGGPLYLITPEGDFVTGVTSRAYIGAPQNAPCKFGGIYVRPQKYLSWIENASGFAIPRPVCNQPPAPTADDIRASKKNGGDTQIFPNDPEGDDQAFTYEVVQQPAFGTASVDSDGVATYTPSGGFKGDDSFVVAVTDGGSAYEASGPATTDLTINVRVGGCGCATSPASPASLGLFALLGLVSLRRRKR